MSATSFASVPVTHLFRVRVARPGVPAFSYIARAASSFDAQIAALDRLIAVDDNAMASITTTLTHSKVLLSVK